MRNKAVLLYLQVQRPSFKFMRMRLDKYSEDVTVIFKSSFSHEK